MRIGLLRICIKIEKKRHKAFAAFTLNFILMPKAKKWNHGNIQEERKSNSYMSYLLTVSVQGYLANLSGKRTAH